jgi:dTMP kinase
MYQIPVPNQVFFLDVRPVTAMQLIANRENKFSHEKEKDIHEKSRTHLSDSYVNALKLVKKYSCETIDCNTENGSIKSIEEINEMIYLRIKTYLEV